MGEHVSQHETVIAVRREQKADEQPTRSAAGLSGGVVRAGGRGLSPAQVLYLQRMGGNQAVAAYLRPVQRQDAPPAEPKVDPGWETEQEGPVVSAHDILSNSTFEADVKEDASIAGSAFGNTTCQLNIQGKLPDQRLPDVQEAGGGDYRITTKYTAILRHGVSGGQGRTNVESTDDKAITYWNWWNVAKDLQPNGTGLPSRDKFWSRRLTAEHELFHVADYKDKVWESIKAGQNWISQKSASSTSEVLDLFIQMFGLIQQSWQAKMEGAGKELRAYMAGKPGYEALANAIRAKGRRKGYGEPPKPPSPPAAEGTP